jgi:hypothetical protein
MSSKPMGLKILAVIVVLATFMAGCTNATPTAAPTAVPTIAPTIDQAPTLSLLGTQVAQTFAANLTLTVPPATPVPPTATLPPTATPPPAVAATAAPTSTPLPPPALPTATSSAFVGTPYRTPTLTTYNCGIISVSPGLKDTIQADTDFMASWWVENTGTETWAVTDVVIQFIKGENFQKTGTSYNLYQSVNPTGSYTVNINMHAPKLAGPYYAQWAFLKGNITVCTLNLTVHVVN